MKSTIYMVGFVPASFLPVLLGKLIPLGQLVVYENDMVRTISTDVFVTKASSDYWIKWIHYRTTDSIEINSAHWPTQDDAFDQTIFKSLQRLNS